LLGQRSGSLRDRNAGWNDGPKEEGWRLWSVVVFDFSDSFTPFCIDKRLIRFDLD
jgi:hypothetical protein